MTSDAGLILVRELDGRLGLVGVGCDRSRVVKSEMSGSRLLLGRGSAHENGLGG